MVSAMNASGKPTAVSRRIGLFRAAAAVLCACAIAASVAVPAYAYFTAQAVGQGSLKLELGPETDIDETFDDWTKHVVIAAAPGSQPSFVRVKAFCSSLYTLHYSDSAGLWSPSADGYWYYTQPIAPGETTSQLDIRIADVPENADEGDEFHVVVIYEYTPVLYDENGQAYADWSLATVTDLPESEVR